MRLFRIAAGILVLVLALVPGLEARKKLLGEGEGVFKTIDLKNLPTFSFEYDLTEEERNYLGLEKSGPFTIQQLDADLLVLEFLNTYCYACALQAPILNQLHARIESREDLRDRVRFFGIAVGNGQKEIDKFKGNFDISYPIVPDPEFGAFDAIGNPGGTPFIVLYPLRSGSLPRAHLGVMREVDDFVAAIETAMSTEAVRETAQPEFKMTTWRNLTPDLTSADIEKRLRASAAEIGRKVVRIEPVEVEGEKNVYRLSAADGSGLWAKVAGRAKICNICHDIFFIILFDDSGKIVNFTPIHVTKYENVPIDEKEAAFMKERVIGRSITEPLHFDSEVDAISQATMSSELIFDTIRRLKDAYERLQK